MLLLSSQDREKERESESEKARLRLAAAVREALWVCLFRLLPPAAATAADSIDYTREWKLTLLMSSLAPTCCTQAGSSSSHGSKALGISEGCLKVGGAHSHTQSRST